jgi:ubiquinone/menaquinone biosynthesis C-methylase UbiE
MDTAGDSGMARLKAVFKPYPRLYHLLVFLFGAQPMHETARSFVKKFPKDAHIINIGSGPRRLRDGVINIDIFQFEGVDIVADATRLPFPDSSADAIVCDNMLEHVKDPGLIVAEIFRVLKRDGEVYVAMPFVMVYHSSPDDYYRWSKQGMRTLMRDFEELELKIQYGPTAAFVFILCEWLALVLSFNTKFLYNTVLVMATIFMAPLKFIDYILRYYKASENMPNSFYFIGRKK